MFTMKPEQKIVSTLIKALDAVESAKQQLLDAQAQQKMEWDVILEKHAQVNGDGWLASWPLPEVAIVQDGSFTYEIKFDYDDWSLPTVRRVEGYIGIMNTKDWS